VDIQISNASLSFSFGHCEDATCRVPSESDPLGSKPQIRNFNRGDMRLGIQQQPPQAVDFELRCQLFGRLRRWEVPSVLGRPNLDRLIPLRILLEEHRFQPMHKRHVKKIDPIRV
jgi:hypothetical protein